MLDTEAEERLGDFIKAVPNPGSLTRGGVTSFPFPFSLVPVSFLVSFVVVTASGVVPLTGVVTAAVLDLFFRSLLKLGSVPLLNALVSFDGLLGGFGLEAALGLAEPLVITSPFTVVGEEEAGPAR